jgi:hypothetical protein
MFKNALVALLALGLAASPAAAKGDKGDKGDKGHGKSEGKGHDKEGEDKEEAKSNDHEREVRVVEKREPERVVVTRTVAPTRVVLADRDREIVRTYYVDTYGRASCPPGLAKKNNGCLPPGQAKKRYVVGRVLPRTIVYETAPTVLVQRLTPLPTGYQYVMVDGDLLKLAVGTRLVVDAIHAFVR